MVGKTLFLHHCKKNKVDERVSKEGSLSRRLIKKERRVLIKYLGKSF